MPDEAKEIKKVQLPAPKPAEGSASEHDASAAPKPPMQLSPVEQMEAFEESLKESDWGHQPC